MPFRVIRIFLILIIIFLVLLLGFSIFIRTRYIPAVLMYHYLSDDIKDKRYISPRAFEEQMRFLKANEYNIISLEEFAEYLRNKKAIPRNTVVITLDDGHIDNYEFAYPILKKYKIPATMFVIAGYFSKPGFVTEEQIKQMSDSGLITIGSHTLGERHLPSIEDEEELKREIFESKKILEIILNKPVSCFSYPIGGFNKKIRQMVIDAGYQVAVATSPGVNYPNNDPFAIKRVRISQNSKSPFIFWFESSGLYKFLLELRKEISYD